MVYISLILDSIFEEFYNQSFSIAGKSMAAKKHSLRNIDYIIESIEKYYYVLLGIVFLFALFNLFYGLKSTPIASFDEARHGVSAFEMLKRKDYIVNTFMFKYDYWNLKPPLSFWLIMLGYKLVGFNTLGLRLYSALAALLTIFVVAFFVRKKHGRLASLISAAVLTTTPQYILAHGARTGDADSLFVLFFTGAMLAMLLSENNKKWLYLAGLSFALAFLTKSWHAFNILMIGVIYLVFSGSLLRIKINQWVVFLVSAVAPIATWGYLRYMKDGLNFFERMVGFDLLARTSTTLEGHVGDGAFYFNYLQENYFFWLVLFIVGIITNLALNGEDLFNQTLRDNRNYVFGIFLWLMVPLLTFSLVRTKISWYMLPIYPVLAILVGVLLGHLLKDHRSNKFLKLALAFAIILTLSIYEPNIKNEIVAMQEDESRTTFTSLSAPILYKGSRVYIAYDITSKDWRQSDLLMAELYGDLRPAYGGLQAYLEDTDENSLIILPKNENYFQIVKNYDLQVVARNGQVNILKKSSGLKT